VFWVITYLRKCKIDNASNVYVTGRNAWRSRSARLVSKLVSPDINDIVLDIGCGTGTQIIELSVYIKQGIGIDISEGMLKQANENARNENIANVEFYIGTFDKPDEKINLREAHVTKIISNYALHHLNFKEKKKAIEKMAYIGGQSLQTIVIGDLMFFEDPNNFKDEFSAIGYGPGSDKPSTAEKLIGCFKNLSFNVEVHKLHPLVGVLVASRRR